MKALLKQIGKRRHLVFLDLEGTQFTHEMIALGAIKVDIGHSGNIRKMHDGIKIFVKPEGKIGNFVIGLTGITKEQLDKEGVSYKEALIKFKKYCGLTFSRSAFITFGSHDLRIIMQSLVHSPDADADTAKLICHNNIDLSATVSQFVKDANNNPLSLMNYLKVFKVTPEGVPHDPLWDAKNLALLYQAILVKDDVLFEEYLKVLKNMRHLPKPVLNAITKLVDGETVKPEEFKKEVKDFVK